MYEWYEASLERQKAKGKRPSPPTNSFIVPTLVGLVATVQNLVRATAGNMAAEDVKEQVMKLLIAICVTAIVGDGQQEVTVVLDWVRMEKGWKDRNMVSPNLKRNPTCSTANTHLTPVRSAHVGVQKAVNAPNCCCHV